MLEEAGIFRASMGLDALTICPHPSTGLPVHATRSPSKCFLLEPASVP